MVVRYQGGNNAGHTVINEYGKFALNLLPVRHLPSTRPSTVLGTGMVIDLEAHLYEEMNTPARKGRRPSRRDNLKISDRAIMVLPIHPAAGQVGGSSGWARITSAPR